MMYRNCCRDIGNKTPITRFLLLRHRNRDSCASPPAWTPPAMPINVFTHSDPYTDGYKIACRTKSCAPSDLRDTLAVAALANLWSAPKNYTLNLYYIYTAWR